MSTSGCLSFPVFADYRNFAALYCQYPARQHNIATTNILHSPVVLAATRPLSARLFNTINARAHAPATGLHGLPATDVFRSTAGTDFENARRRDLRRAVSF